MNTTIKVPDANGDLYLQWEDPFDWRIVRWFPRLADRFPWFFRYFVLRRDQTKAAEIPIRHQKLMRRRLHRYLALCAA